MWSYISLHNLGFKTEKKNHPCVFLRCLKFSWKFFRLFSCNFYFILSLQVKFWLFNMNFEQIIAHGKTIRKRKKLKSEIKRKKDPSIQNQDQIQNQDDGETRENVEEQPTKKRKLSSKQKKRLKNYLVRYWCSFLCILSKNILTFATHYVGKKDEREGKGDHFK